MKTIEAKTVEAERRRARESAVAAVTLLLFAVGMAAAKLLLLPSLSTDFVIGIAIGAAAMAGLLGLASRTVRQLD